MRKRMTIKNFIIYFLLAVLIVTGSGSGLDITQQVLSSCHHTEHKTLTAQSLIPSDEFSEFEIVEKSASVSSITNLRYRRSGFSYRCNLFFLCTLAFLSGIFLFDRESLTLHGTRYVHENHYNITFMQDMDGRKRIS